MQLSVIIPTHHPDALRLERTLAGLRVQTLPAGKWETILVNNASSHFPDAAFFDARAPKANFSVRQESNLGLASARRCGLMAARGECAVLVDDDNVLAPDYLAEVLALFDAHPGVGALGGRSLPEFAVEPPAWAHEFFPLLALRDPGATPMVSRGLRRPGAVHNEYPACAPIGAGMALRRAAWMAWLDARSTGGATLTDRRGRELTSSGDNDIVFCTMRAGWEVAYFPSLALTHLIPAERLQPDYLARLNRGIQKSWMQVLTLHDANPWPPLSRLGARLRKARAWFYHRPWRSPAARIRWQGACGHFEGRIKA